MFDANYFNGHFYEQINELGGCVCRVEIHLYNGSLYNVHALKKIEQSYITFEVYPPEGVTEKSKTARRKVGGNEEVFFDRIAIPYENISLVLLTLKDAEKQHVMGFHANA